MTHFLAIIVNEILTFVIGDLEKVGQGDSIGFLMALFDGKYQIQ